ncbi:hypothetical protein JCM3770_003544 [Rhodotorula araucariae]
MPRASSALDSPSGASTPEPAAVAGANSDDRPHSRAHSTDGGDVDEIKVDPLAQLELEAFGTDAVDDSLPAPPRDPNALKDAVAGGAATGPATAGAGAAALAGQGAGAKRSLAASGPLARAKRPKNVKFSPAKTGKALARRSAAAAVVDNGGAFMLPNHDYCDACGGKGHFLCCEGGCLRSFHFSCLEPPLELDEVPEDSWYCKACRANIDPPPVNKHRFFGELILRVETENPKQFSLPPDIKGFFKNVATGTSGEFIDSVEHRPPSKITGRAIGQEDRDGFRLKDKNGRPIICYNCDGAANPTQRRRIISCDFCDQHWHLDCLDPPMTGMPPPTRKWMCPLHSDAIVPRKRQPKQMQLVTVDRPYRPNNGDIVVVPRKEEPQQHDVDEMTVNRVRYQVPEQHIILDFWGRVTGKKSLPPAPSKKAKGKSPRKRSAAGYESGDSSPLSDLTSSDESDSDRETPSGAALVAPSALDSLALLAEVRYIDYLASQQQPGPNGTSAKAGAPLAAAGKGASLIRDLPPALPNSTQRRLPPRGLAGPPAGAGPAAALGAKRPSFGAGGAASFGSPVGGAAGPSRSRGASPSVSPAPGKLAEPTVESKEDLKALGHVRKLLAAQSKLKDGDANKTALLEYLEGAFVVPRLKTVPVGPTPWQRPWDDVPGGGKKPTGAAQASPPAVSPIPSPALGTPAVAQPASVGTTSAAAAPARAPAPVDKAASASPAPPAPTAPVAIDAAPAPAPAFAKAPEAADSSTTTAATALGCSALASPAQRTPLPVSAAAGASPVLAGSASGAGASPVLAGSASGADAPLPFSLPGSTSVPATLPAPAPAPAPVSANAAAEVKTEDRDAMDVDAPTGGANGA